LTRRRDRPHPHQVGPEGAHQVTRIGLLAQPARIVARRQNDGRAVVNVCDQLIGVGGDDGERPRPLARGRLLPVSPNPGEAGRGRRLYSELLCRPKRRPPLITPGERDEIAFRELDYATNIFTRNGTYCAIIMFKWFLRAVAVANQEPESLSSQHNQSRPSA
jgi:hypothetical protein